MAIVSYTSPLWATAFLLLLLLCREAAPFRHYTAWSDDHWCDLTKDPHWPFAYAKFLGQEKEEKGRVATNIQNLGHVCNKRGAWSKCYICEDIQCGTEANQTCAMQIQGISTANLPTNIPTVSDTPFAVGPRVQHRNDFGNSDRVCVLVTGGDCLTGFASQRDYTACQVRCWGQNGGTPIPSSFGWTYPDVKQQAQPPQGVVGTLAGNGHKGYADGPAATAEFNNPTGIAIDDFGVLYVADTDNHRIRKITSDGQVTTIAGTGFDSFRDGPAMDAMFSSPTGIAVYHDYDLHPTEPIIYIADTYNHRIRRLFNGQVTTYAGYNESGFFDGPAHLARFDLPQALTVDPNGVVYVADTYNHLIRIIDLNATVSTLAGHVSASPCYSPLQNPDPSLPSYASFPPPGPSLPTSSFLLLPSSFLLLPSSFLLLPPPSSSFLLLPPPSSSFLTAFLTSSLLVCVETCSFSADHSFST